MATVKLYGGKKPNTMTGIVPNPPTEPIVDNKIREEWNKYLDWLEFKGMRGKPDLDKNDLGGKMIDTYRKQNPNTPITREIIPAIQKDFSKYRDWSLEEIKAGRSALAPGTTPENYLRALSIVDGIPGQRTTTFKFPSKYMETYNNGKLVANEKTGFATVNPIK